MLVQVLSGQFPCVGNKLGGYPKPTKSFEIVSILVDACDGSNEGQNEMFCINTGPNEIRVGNFTIANYVSGMVNWGSSSNPWRGFCVSNTVINQKINRINQSIKSAGRCGNFVFVGPNDPIPPYSQLLIITSKDFNPTAHDFSNVEDSIYVAIQVSGNTAGHFVNSGNNATRTLRLYYGSDWDEVSYNRSKLRKQDLSVGGEDGAVVNFLYNGTPEYTNYGCSVPFAKPIIKAGSIDPSSCDQEFIELKGISVGYHCYYWKTTSNQGGFFEDSTSLNTRFYFGSKKSKSYVLYLTATNNYGTEIKDSVTFAFPQGPTADIVVDSSQHPVFCFSNNSTDADYYQWNYNSNVKDSVWGTQNISEEPCFNIENQRMKICLTALNTFTGCVDSICVALEDHKADNEARYIFIANVFTPGVKDGINDELQVKSEGIEEIKFVIFNRWGVEVFNSETIENWQSNWNGQVQNSGEDCPSGSYFYILNYILNEEQKSVKGSVTLIR